MSRVYTIAVSEKVRRVVHLTDHVGTRIDWLEILPPEEMAGLRAPEKRLAEVQPELDRVGTEVTKAALVAKARRLAERPRTPPGQVKRDACAVLARPFRMHRD